MSSSIGRPREQRNGGICYAIGRKQCSIEKIDVSVKHATSPPRRDCSWQVVISRVIKVQPLPNKIVQPLRRLVQPVFNYPPASSFAHACRTLVPTSLVQNERDTKASPEKFRHNPTVPISL